MHDLREPRLKLFVVGGQEGLRESYRKKCERLGLENQVIFAGMQRDVRPFMWAADAFVLPSFYEIFPLVALEAAAAGLPLIVSPLYGVEEFLINGENGFLTEPTSEAIGERLRQLMDAPAEKRMDVGRRAAASIAPFGTAAFGGRWRKVYAR